MSETRRALLLASLVPFGLFLMLGLVAGHGWLGTGEVDGPSASIRGWAVRQPWLADSLFLVERMFAEQGLTVATLALVGWLLLRRRFRAVAFVLVAMLAAREIAGASKELFGRDRPAWQAPEFLHHAGSYPSGHATGAATLVGVVIVLAVLGSRTRAFGRLAGLVGVAVVVAVCADRLLLGRHYPTDLIGGILLATGLVLSGAALLLLPDDEGDATLADDAPSKVAQADLVSRSA